MAGGGVHIWCTWPPKSVKPSIWPRRQTYTICDVHRICRPTPAKKLLPRGRLAASPSVTKGGMGPDTTTGNAHPARPSGNENLRALGWIWQWTGRVSN